VSVMFCLGPSTWLGRVALTSVRGKIMFLSSLQQKFALK
jgi:hypothetical protein